MRSRVIFLSLAALSRCEQPSAPSATAAELRSLQFAQINFLHTTDTHGWHAGHLQEPSYSADWGDYISFASHLRDRADEEGVDLYLVDTGDRVEGNGLYDGSEPKGLYTFDIIKQQEIDLICSGNHELYKANSSDNEFQQTVPNFKGNYLASNLDIYDPESGKMIPLAPRYKKFITRIQGIRITAFGFMFNFRGSSNNTVVTPVQETIKQDWFQDAIRDRDVDLFVVIGHIGLRMEEFQLIFKAIRGEQWDTPIQFFGGHTHIRDAVKYDDKAYGLESGRYMETIGFASIDGLQLKKGKKTPYVPTARAAPAFNRRYIDNNLYSYHAHTGLNDSNFPTEHGLNVSKQIAEARSKLKLDHTHGCAPQDLWLNRAELNSNTSIFSWLGSQVLPDQFTNPEEKDAKPKLVITNTGAIRFDIFKGPFTRDTAFLIAPFTSGFRVLKDIKYDIGVKVLEVLNSADKVLQQMDPTLDTSLLFATPPARLDTDMKPSSPYSRPDLATLDTPTLYSNDNGHQQPLKTNTQSTSNIRTDVEDEQKEKKNPTPGYTTVDDLGSDGDDTVHSQISYYGVPNCIQSEVDFPSEGKEAPEKVDLVYNEFIESWIIAALKFLGATVDKKDTDSAMDGKSMTDIINDWVENNWPCEDMKEGMNVSDEL